MRCGNCGSSYLVNTGFNYECQDCGANVSYDGTFEEESPFEKALDLMSDREFEESQWEEDDDDDFDDPDDEL